MPRQTRASVDDGNDVKKLANGAEKQLNEIRSLLFADTVADLKSEMDSRFEGDAASLKALENLIHSKAEELDKKLSTEVKRIENLLADQNKSLVALERQTKDDKDSLEQSLSTLQKWAESEHESITGELVEKFDKTNDHLESVQKSLEHKKLDRSQFASMLTTLAQEILADSEEHGD